MNSPNLKILIVEDDEFMIKIFEFLLKKEGFEVVSCKDGSSAIEKHIAFMPDLIIANTKLPFRSALEIIKFSKEAFENIPIILICSLEEEMMILEAFNLGVDDFVSIPLNPNELLLRVKRLLKKIEHKTKKLSAYIAA